jgi:hypothetical protein
MWLLDGMDIDALVVRDGDQVQASGRLVLDRSGEWFEPTLPVAGPGGRERYVRPVWGVGAVRVVGADFASLSNRFERNGGVEGWAFLSGVWFRQQLVVEKQAAPRADTARQHSWVSPPCPPPHGGWPAVVRRGDVELEYDLGDLRETGAAVAVTLFHPGEGQAVLVIAASDVAAVEAQLRPQLGRSLCIVSSRWSKAQLDAVGDYLLRHHEQWSIYQWGPRNDHDGQASVAARLVRVLPEIAAWAGTIPSGILLLDPWLMPTRAVPAQEVVDASHE